MFALHLFLQIHLLTKACLFSEHLVFTITFVLFNTSCKEVKYYFPRFIFWQSETCSCPRKPQKLSGNQWRPPSCLLSTHPASLLCFWCRWHCLPTLPVHLSHNGECSATETRARLSEVGQRNAVSSHLWKFWFPWHSLHEKAPVSWSKNRTLLFRCLSPKAGSALPLANSSTEQWTSWEEKKISSEGVNY